ncbi:MAG: ABC transporter permease [Thermoplasmata archaeon]|nr:ABC transporter permease [Thermoplasmata archaeon]
MRALPADLRRTFLTPVTLALLVVAIALATIFSPAVPAETTFPGQFAVSYEYQGGWIFRFFVFNGTGLPVGGATVSASLQAINSSTPGGAVGFATTDSSGFATVRLAGNDTNSSVQYDVGGGGGESFNGGSVSAAPPGVVVPSFGAFTEIGGGPYGLVPKMLLFYPGPDGGAPTGTRVVIDANYSGPDSRTVNLSSTPLDGPTGVFGIPPTSLPMKASRIDFLLIGPGGSVLAERSQSPSDLQEYQYGETPWGRQLDVTVGLWGFVAPLLGIVAGYSAYARDRSSRALEPVLGLPTTQLRIMARRYLSALVPLAVGLGAAVLIDFQWNHSPSHGFAPVLVVVIFGSLLLEAAAFLGLTVLLSHLLRSSGAVVGLGATLTALLNFFLVPLAYVVAESVGYMPSDSTVISLAFSPPTHLTSGAVTGFFATLGSPFPVGTSVGSVVFVPLALTLAIAIATPLSAAYLALRRD